MIVEQNTCSNVAKSVISSLSPIKVMNILFVKGTHLIHQNYLEGLTLDKIV